jgi:hypothetical protein
MSGYGGQPPSDWQGQYGQQPYGQDPYAQHYAQGQQQHYAQGQQQYAQGGQDSFGGMYGPPGVPPVPRPSNAAAVGAIIGNCIGLVFVCGIGIAWLPGLILGGMAVNKIESDPAAARDLTKYSWICCGLNFLIEIVIFLLVYLLGQ